jgi:pimeloyl-ACP methyl ester carboxylesterase
MAGLVGFRQLGLSFLLAHLADATSGCTGNAEKNPKAHHNLLVYSHGYGGNMDMATYFLSRFARLGFIVAAIEHTDGTASSTVLADGTRLDFDPSLCSPEDGLRLRAREMLEAVDYIPSLFPHFSGNVLLGGHSYGAPSALLASQQRPEGISGLVLHDPALAMGSGLLELPPRIPAVSYVSDEYCRAGIRCGDATYHVEGAFHGNFVDAPLWAPLWVMRALSLVIPACGPADPEKVHLELAESAKAFTADPIGMGGVKKSLFERVR